MTREKTLEVISAIAWGYQVENIKDGSFSLEIELLADKLKTAHYEHFDEPMKNHE